MTRKLALEGVENFRDFGGYATATGGRLRERRLYRSASHGRATDADLEVIHGLNIAVVVDLRRKHERLRDPSRRHGAFGAEVVENDDGGEAEDDSWIAHITRSDLTEGSFRDYMFGYYREAPFNPRLIDLYTRYFEVLARTEIRPPRIPVYSNVDAVPHTEEPQGIKNTLAVQVTRGVRWEESMRRMLADGFDTFYEIGPGRVLTALLKRIDRKVPCTHVPAR